jgi:rhodanese-related sulfurtransferase
MPMLVIGGGILAILVVKRLGQISPAEARQHVEAGAKLIDVRTPGEFASRHLEGAMNVPLNTLSARADSLGPKDATYVLYCASGTRSAVAKSALKARGFTKVFNLGSMSRWR